MISLLFAFLLVPGLFVTLSKAVVLPICAQSCAESSATVVGCASINDTACLCDSQRFQNFETSTLICATTFAIPRCGLDDQSFTRLSLEDMCRNLSSSSSSLTSTASSSLSVTETASSASISSLLASSTTSSTISSTTFSPTSLSTASSTSTTAQKTTTLFTTVAVLPTDAITANSGSSSFSKSNFIAGIYLLYLGMVFNGL
ncbi:hypothetical protein C8J56DRAFT_952475 [Mycena floridula]|nr:hypothetical protein C8J56DRAFT_952475 [Mycena floridula]